MLFVQAKHTRCYSLLCYLYDWKNNDEFSFDKCSLHLLFRYANLDYDENWFFLCHFDKYSEMIKHCS